MKYVLNFIIPILLFTVTSCGQTTSSEHVNLTAAETKELLESDQELVILDVRTSQEYRQGHLTGARNIDYTSDDFEKELANLDTSVTYLLYCASGNRSGKATSIMKAKDFNHIFNSTAGFTQLKAAGIPVK